MAHNQVATGQQQQQKQLKQHDSLDSSVCWRHLEEAENGRNSGRRTRSIGSPPSSSANSSPTSSCAGSPSRQAPVPAGGGKCSPPRRPPRQSMISSHSPFHMAALFASAAKAALNGAAGTTAPGGMIEDESGRRLFMHPDEVFKVWEENMRLADEDTTPYHQQQQQQQHKQSCSSSGAVVGGQDGGVRRQSGQQQQQQQRQQSVCVRKLMMKRSVSELEDYYNNDSSSVKQPEFIATTTSAISLVDAAADDDIGALKLSTGSMPTDVLIQRNHSVVGKQQQRLSSAGLGAATSRPSQQSLLATNSHGEKSPAARRFNGLYATEAAPPNVAIRRVALDNDYKVLKEIGAGQFGMLNLAEHLQSKKRITLKFFARPQARLVDFVREYEIAYFLSPHLNILDTFEGCFETDDESAYFFVQEQMPNSTLRDLLNSHSGGLGESASKAVLGKVFAAVEFMHSNGLVHRNIRAENVLIFDPGKFTRVKLTEFGPTRPVEATVRHTELVSSYHAPELCERVPNETYQVLRTSDVWSLGVLMAYCMKGKFPWQKATIMCKPYWEWDQWLKRKAIQQPKYWDVFSEKAMRLFKHTLSPKPKERWEVREMRKLAEKERLAKAKVCPDDEVYYPDDEDDDGQQQPHSGGSTANLASNNKSAAFSAAAAAAAAAAQDTTNNKQAKKQSAIGQWINNTLTTMNQISEQVVSARDE